MKRSQINTAIKEAIDFFKYQKFKLPPFAYRTLEEWRQAHHIEEIVESHLGWDVTSFGSGDFEHTGLLLFTLRNGKPNSPYCKPYAEKIMMVRENQVTPRHFHWHKQEDIINRGGGNLIIELFHADPTDSHLTGRNFSIHVDGEVRTMRSGDRLILMPGESVTFENCHAHTFYGETGKGSVLVGEVSMVNDDAGDNCFIDGTPRFDPIIEDEPIRYLLAGDYERMLS